MGHLNRGIDAYNDQNIESAKRHFGQALIQDPNNEVAWLWLAEASRDDGEQLYCLDRAVALNPDSTGSVERAALRARGVTPTVPPVIADLKQPPMPPRFQKTVASRGLPVRLPRAGRPLTRPRVLRAATGDASKPKASGSSWPLWVAGALLLVAIGSFALIWWNDDASADALVIAVVGPMSGADASIGNEIRNGASIAASDFNTGTSGAPITLVFFDDQNDPAKAVEVARAIVADGRFIGVIGHGTSATSLAAAPIYQAAGMPAISAQATDDRLAEYPDYFRTIFSNKTEATILASYLIDVLKQDTVTIVTGESDYERSLTADFEGVFPAREGKVAQVFTIASDDPDSSIADIVSKLKANPGGGVVFLALTEARGHDFLLASKRAGVSQPMVGSEALG
ncbi:MAG TPA: ABC transporter substrate-binding protein, partial [Thermomicrobiales bacterium]|nr:ABC transporter substrate-binding protein [Thermomicrobiales bacterium]